MANTKALVFIGLGAFFAIVGAGLLCGGGFNSVMQDAENGPFSRDLTLANNAATAATEPFTLNNGHFVSLIAQYPEIFNCNDVQDLHENLATDSAGLFLATDSTWSQAAWSNAAFTPLAAGVASEDLVDNAKAYCRFHDGEQAWTFAFYFPTALLVLILAFTAFIRKSGYTLSLVGVGLSAVMISFTLIIIVHYQGHSFVPRALDAFGDCDDFKSVAATLAAYKFGNSNQVGSLVGPTPRRSWLCEDNWDYDDDLRTAANLVYGGAAVAFLGWLFTLIGFAYLVQPIVTPVPAFAKNPTALAGSFRGSDVDFDDESSYTYSEEYDY